MRFIPAYSALILLIRQALKKIKANQILTDQIDKICQPIIDKIESQLVNKLNLAYPDYALKKLLNI